MYRFNLNGTHVECDSTTELLAVLGREPVKLTTPTTPTKRARKKAKLANLGATMSWRAAELYAKRSNGRLTVNQARSFLSENPDQKQKLLAELASK